MEERRQQNAATRPIEQCSRDDAYRQASSKECRERPLTLLGSAQEEGRQMPQPPYGSKNQRGPDWTSGGICPGTYGFEKSSVQTS